MPSWRSRVSRHVRAAREQPGRPGMIIGGPLISSKTTMVTAWEFPRNPLTDPGLDNSRLSNEIREGFRHLHQHAAPRPGDSRPAKCPATTVISTEASARNRCRSSASPACFRNTTGAPAGCSRSATVSSTASCAVRMRPEICRQAKSCRRPTAKEVLALSAYLTWLSQGTRWERIRHGAARTRFQPRS